MTDGVEVPRTDRFGPRGPARTISRAVGLAVVMFEAVAAFWLVMLLRTSDLVPSDPRSGVGRGDQVELRMLTAVDVHDWVSALSAAAFAAGVAGALVAHLLPAVKGRAPVE
ncbi:hypothetical protein [Gordonia hongkongensis]|uniref:hypothetical protein n=1 Tax=Gordonia hongkongensis TaxID=1701090 RepID=UPI003EB75D27